MVIQYPHNGKVYLPSDSVKDAEGNWSESSLELLLETRCRVEPNKTSQYLVGAGGKQITFSSIVYLPLPRIISLPADIDVPSGSTIIYSGETVLYVVPDDIGEGENEVSIPDKINGQRFYLKVDGIPLKEGTDFEILQNGFRLLNDTLIDTQRYELTKYYEVNKYISGSSGPLLSGDLDIKPGTLFEVWDGELLKIRETVKQFSKGQLNARVWL